MSNLVTKLGGFSLIIVQAGRYMRETGTNCQKYLRLYNIFWSEFQTNISRLRDYLNENIQIIWNIFYECVKQIDLTTAKFFQFWIYFDNQDLWFELLKRDSRDFKNPIWLQDFVRSEIDFGRTIKKLFVYSLIELYQNIENYSIHSIVHDWCLESINKNKFELMILITTIVEFAASE